MSTLGNAPGAAAASSASVVLAAIVLAGCGAEVSDPAAGGAADDPTPRGLTTRVPYEPEPLPPPPAPPVASPARCGSTDLLVVATGPVEPALGHRYLPLAVENCSADPVRLDELPTLRAEDDDGRALRLRARVKRGVPVVPHALAPGQRVHLGLEWVPRGTGRAEVATLVLRLPSTGSEHRLVDEVGLDLDGRDRVEVHPWAASRDQVFRLTR